MRGKYRIYASYAAVMLVGVFMFVALIFFIEKNNANLVLETLHTTQTFQPLNKDLEEPIKMIDNIEAIEPKEEKIVKKIYAVNADVLNIREKPSVESKVIKKYINGNNIEIINISDGWGELRSGGFAYMELLRENDDENAQLASDDGIGTYTIKVNILNIRENPSVESKIIAKMSINQKILIESIEGEWGKVVGSGFVYMELLSKD